MALKYKIIAMLKKYYKYGEWGGGTGSLFPSHLKYAPGCHRTGFVAFVSACSTKRVLSSTVHGDRSSVRVRRRFRSRPVAARLVLRYPRGPSFLVKAHASVPRLTGRGARSLPVFVFFKRATKNTTNNTQLGSRGKKKICRRPPNSNKHACFVRVVRRNANERRPP